jgi:hypothetical protein
MEQAGHPQAEAQPVDEGPAYTRVTERQKAKICFLAGKGLSSGQIGSRMRPRRDHRTVEYHLAQLLEEEDAPDTPEPEIQLNFDPYRTLCERFILEHYIMFRVIENPLVTVREIANSTRGKFWFHREKSTVAALMDEMGIRSTQSIKRPKMTEAHMQYRTAFAHALLDPQSPYACYLNYDWLFTDECSLQLNPNRDTIHKVPGIDNELYYQDFQQRTGRVMVFGAISRNYKSPLIRINGSETAQVYREMLEQSGIITAMHELHRRDAEWINPWIFQDDGASPHRAIETRKWLSERCFILPPELHWPAHSPDLNPIEQLWNILKQKLDVKQIKTPDELFQAAVQLWDEIDMATINNLVDSFRARLETVGVLSGRCLNGHRATLHEVEKGLKPIAQIDAEMREAEGQVRVFVETSRAFFEMIARYGTAIDEPIRHGTIEQSVDIVRHLPERARRKMDLDPLMDAIQVWHAAG